MGRGPSRERRRPGRRLRLGYHATRTGLPREAESEAEFSESYFSVFFDRRRGQRGARGTYDSQAARGPARGSSSLHDPAEEERKVSAQVASTSLGMSCERRRRGVRDARGRSGIAYRAGSSHAIGRGTRWVHSRELHGASPRQDRSPRGP